MKAAKKQAKEPSRPDGYTVRFQATDKQRKALKYLYDDTTEEVFFGGGARGGKSYLGCFWLISNLLRYDETKALMARYRLKDLKQSTLETLFQVANEVFNLTIDEDYKYKGNKAEVVFYNGSKIVLDELRDKPRDPNFERFGSKEYTWLFVDEVSQISHKAKDIIMTRLQYKTDVYDIVGKGLFVSNPAKNWAYSEFYLPWKKDNLPEERAFIQALVKDNPYVEQGYIDKLKRRSPAVQERLLYGNWEYDDDPSTLMDYDRTQDLFTNTHVEASIDTSDRYLVADLAMQGRDRFVVTVWNGMVGRVVYCTTDATGKEIEEKLKDFAEEYEVPRSHIIYDSGGLGNYLQSYLKGATEFRSNETPSDKDKFKNLRAECYYKLASLVNNAEIHVKGVTEDQRNEIVRELGQVKEKYPGDPEKKHAIVPKSEIQDKIGRSPDFADVLMMRMKTLVKQQKVFIGRI